MRPSIGTGRGDAETIRTFFENFEIDIDNVWRARFQSMQRDIEQLTGKTGLVAERVDALSHSFAVLMAATSRAQQSDLVVNGPGTPAAAKALIEANGKFAASTAGFPAGLGPKASQAWTAWEKDPQSRAWEQTIAQTVDTALAGLRSPLATNTLAYGVAFTKEPHWLNELTAVTVGASTDMRDVAHREALSAARSYRNELDDLRLQRPDRGRCHGPAGTCGRATAAAAVRRRRVAWPRAISRSRACGPAAPARLPTRSLPSMR